MKSIFIKIRSIFFLSIFLLSIFFCIAMPFEIRKAIASQSWEPREIHILSSEIVSTKDRRNGTLHISHSIRIKATDLSNNEQITIKDIKYGDIPFTFSVFGKAIAGDLIKYLDKYPPNKKVIGYKDPNSSKYILEESNITQPLVILIIAALWILGNILIMIFFPKKKKNQMLDIELD